MTCTCARLQRVGEGGHHVRIPAEDFDALAPVALGVPLADEMVERHTAKLVHRAAAELQISISVVTPTGKTISDFRTHQVIHVSR